MKRITVTTIGLFLITVVNAQTQVPHDFTAGTPARAAEVNANFDALESAVDQNAEDISTNTTATAVNAGNISDNAAAIEEIGVGCSATQQGNSVLIACGDGTGGVIAGAGTVVLYPEGQIGEVPPIDYNTGPIVLSDASGVVLGEVVYIFGP